MKYWPGRSHIVMKSTPKVTGDIPLLAIRYKYRYQKVLGFINTKGAVSTETGVPYFSHYPENYSHVSIFPVLFTHVIDRYFSDFY